MSRAASRHIARGDLHAVAPYAVFVDLDAEAWPVDAVSVAFAGRNRMGGYVIG
jgi:hypothetical protein